MTTRLNEFASESRDPRGEAPTWVDASRLRVLFLVSAHNSLSQSAYIALTELGHDVSVEVVHSGEVKAAVARQRPELIVCPMLKKSIPELIWENHRCLVVHPGPKGDRGPSSLDWAIELGMSEWGVTVLEANGELDAGDVWATRTFAMRDAGKSSLYRHEVRRATVGALVQALTKIARGEFSAEALHAGDPTVVGRARPAMRQVDRALDWSADGMSTLVRRIHAADGHPGVLDLIAGGEFQVFGAHPERSLRGEPGAIIAQRHGGAVWITHLRRRDEDERPSCKLPATRALTLAGREVDAPEVPVPVEAPIPAGQPIARSRMGGRGRRLPALRLLQQRHEDAGRQVKPLEVYRGEELARCHDCFFGPERSYHEARRRFVYKLAPPCAVSSPAHRAVSTSHAGANPAAAGHSST